MFVNELPFAMLGIPSAYAQAPAARAQEPERSPSALGLIPILVEESLLNDSATYTSAGRSATMTEHIFAYAQNIQNRVPHSKAFVIPVSPTEDPFKIATVLERLYYEGFNSSLLDTSAGNDSWLPEDDNYLIGTVLVGDVPLPVVQVDEKPAISIYPYTDFYRKAYIYNHLTGQFEQNADVGAPNPDVWHGVIRASRTGVEGRQQLADYFDKNNQYSVGNPVYRDFNERILVANPWREGDLLNPTEYQNYNHWLRYLEEMAYQRFNKHLLKDLMAVITEESGSAPIDPSQIDAIPDISTKFIFEKYTTRFAQTLKTHLGRLNEMIDTTGRWTDTSFDTIPELITLRDENMRLTLLSKNSELEGEINRAIDQIDRPLNVVNGATIRVVTRYQNCVTVAGTRTCYDRTNTESFAFETWLAGQRINDLASAQQCGMVRGQKRSTGETVLQNNSVQVVANRLYSTDSVIIPDEDDDSVKDRRDYRQYAGCVGNNMIAITDPEVFGPQLCLPDNSVRPLFDITGSREVATTYPPNRCDAALMNVRSVTDEISDLQDDADVFSSAAARMLIPGVINYSENLNGVITRWFNDLVNRGRLTGSPAALAMRTRATAVYRGVVNNPYAFTYRPQGGVTVTVTLVPSTKPLLGMVLHNEPSADTLQKIRASQITPSTPADAKRFVEFNTLGVNDTYYYPNLFRVQGITLDEVTDNLLTLIREKDEELNAKLGYRANVIANFYRQNPDVIEAIWWHNIGIDQKYQSVLQNYLDRNGYVPTVTARAPVPQTKPQNGYEVFHLFAQGDPRGFEFGLNAAVTESAGLTDAESQAADELANQEEATAQSTGVDSSGGQEDDEDEYLCGDPSGVEIWEWIPAVQCWIENDIIKASENFGLQFACGVDPTAPDDEDSNLPEPPSSSTPPVLPTSATPIGGTPTVDINTQNYLSALIDDTGATPVALDATLDRATLVPGETITIKVTPKNASGEKIYGYIATPLAASVEGNIGTVDPVSQTIFSGEGEITFTAQNPGVGTINVAMGVAATTLQLRVAEEIHVQLSATDASQNGVARYDIAARLVDESGNPVTNISTDIAIKPFRPSDGIMQDGGQVKLVNGVGTAALFPNPTARQIQVTALSSNYSSQDATINLPVGQPKRISVKMPRALPVGQTVDVSVRVTDLAGATATGFSGELVGVVTSATREYGSLESSTIAITNGQGTMRLKLASKTGPLTIVLRHQDLITATVTGQVMARVEGQNWDGKFPQALVASLVGFPAANVLEPNYYGGEQLFAGKTQSVFGFMTGAEQPPLLTIHPNFKVNTTLPSQQIFVQPAGDTILLQVLDRNTYQNLATIQMPLNFAATQQGRESEVTEPNTLYVELVSGTHQLITTADGFDLADEAGARVASLNRNRIVFHDFQYALVADTESDLPMPEFLVVSPTGEAVARLFLNFLPRTIRAENVDFPSALAARPLVSGNSTARPTGLVLFDPAAEPEDPLEIADNFGFIGEQKYLLRFAAGNSIGESVRYSLPVNGLLLGDPTITLATRSRSSLDYDSTIGQVLFQDPEGATIQALTEFDFNNDSRRDTALVMSDGRVRLLEAGPTQPQFRDRGDIAFLADGTIAIESFDFAGDGYEDLVVATEQGRLGILDNENEVITRSTLQLDVGKKVYELQKADLDQDGNPDLVLLDSRGDLLIFYNTGQGFNETPDIKLANYGITLKNSNLKKDLKVRYPGMPEPAPAGARPASSTPPIALSSDTPFSIGALPGLLSPDESMSLIQGLADSAAVARAGTGTQATGDSLPLLPWNEGDATQTTFEPIDKSGSFTTNKRVANADRPGERNVDIEENLKYTITLTSSRNLNGLTLADTVPDALTADPDSVECSGSGCSAMEVKQNGINLFFGNLSPRAGSPLTITYTAAVKNTPKATFFIEKITDPGKSDLYLDVAVSPPYNNTGELIKHYTIGPRRYSSFATSTPPSAAEEAMAAQNECLAALDEMNSVKVDKDNPMPESITNKVNTACGLDKVMSDIQNGKANPSGVADPCSPDEYAQGGAAAESCNQSLLDEVGKVVNAFACGGGGCFPTPWNTAFLVPSPGFAVPAIAFPTTIQAGPIPVPVPSFFLAPSPIGAADIPGPFMSMIRFYVSPTLTGGVGLALCWGPYTGNIPAPPPVFPIPYPPPIGNCMVYALPMYDINPLCSEIAEQMNKLMQAANSVVSDVTSGISAINGNNGGYASVDTTDEQGAGGLEVSLALNLGDTSSFDVPKQSFSNIHIPAFDSIGNVLSSWFDRQIVEIQSKLLVLPKFFINLPHLAQIFVNDTGDMAAAFKNLKNNFSTEPATAIPTAGDTETSSGSLLEKMQAFESAASLYGVDYLADLYDLLDTIPMVKLTTNPITFKIPWLSAAQIADFINDLQVWELHIRREVERVTQKWDEISCPIQSGQIPEGSTEAGIRSACIAREIADKFIVDIQPTLDSIQENIRILQSYQNFPKEFIKFKRQAADYIRALGCYLEEIANMLGGWLGTVREQIISYVEVYYTIIEIIKNITDLINLFTDFNDECDICTNERNANFGWITLLGLILPDIPIIKFPKWPDVVFDISDVDAQIDVQLPIVDFVAEPIKLPRLPFITLPDFPDISVLYAFPPIPTLPSLPELPDLPSLPGIPVIKLPTLPPPPKLPDIGAAFEVIVPLIETVLKIFCLLKKALAPIPESMLMDQITLLTNRPSYLTPLDILKPQFPDIPGPDLGFNEIRVESKLLMGVRIQAVFKTMEDAASEWNGAISDFADLFNTATQTWINQQAAAIQSKLDALGTELDALAARLESTLQSGQDLLEGELPQREQEAQAITEEINQVLEQVKTQEQIAEELRARQEAQEESTKNFLRAILDGSSQGIQNFGPALEKFLREKAASSQSSLPLLHAPKPSVRVATTSGSLQELGAAWNQITKAIEDANNNLVDYTKVKKDLGVPDYRLPNIPTFEDKMQKIQRELVAYVEKLEADVDRAEAGNDLIALADNIPANQPQFILAEETIRQEARPSSVAIQPLADEVQVIAQDFRSILESFGAQIPEIPGLPQPSTGTSTPSATTATTSAPAPSGSGTCVGTCLIDPVTKQSVQLISHSDVPAKVRTEFVPTAVAGKSNIVVADGSRAYLKRNLRVGTSIENRAGRVNNTFFTLDYLLQRGGQTMPTMEAMNMLKTTVTGNGSSTFGWKPVTNPLFYGVGLEVEQSIRGFDAKAQNNGHADLRVILLPMDEGGIPPEIRVGDQVVPFGTLITSVDDEEEARAKFPMLHRQLVAGAQRVTFESIGGATITLKPDTAIYVDQLKGPTYTLNMANGFYHVRATWFDRFGRTATYNQNEILAPQIYGSTAAPVDVAFDREILVPIYKSGVLSAADVFVDLDGALKYYWDTNRDGLPEHEGVTFELPAQSEPKSFDIDLIATRDLLDPSFERYIKTIKVTIYVPEIALEETPLKQEGVVAGIMTPREENNDLANIPFSLFRKRWETWKNLGQIKQQSGNPTQPPLSDQFGFTQNYYTQSVSGEYTITNLTAGPPSSVIVNNQAGQTVARVNVDTGQIELLQGGYELQALPASVTLPTRVAVVESASGQIVSNVYYVADGNTDVSISNASLTATTRAAIGVSLGDANGGDDIIARNIPGSAPSYPGGAAIFHDPSQTNIALISTNGAIRLMKSGYKLKIKNAGKANEPIIFQIVTNGGSPVFDVFIQADFQNLEIRPKELWSDLVPTIGQLKKTFAWIPAALAQSPATPESPFSDLDAAHPQFQAILKLYQRRIIEGYGDGSFRPDAKITRAEFVKIALGATNCFDCSKPTNAQAARYGNLLPFPDVILEAWYRLCIIIAKELGMITGYGDGFFRPEQNISRAEAAAILLRQSNLDVIVAPSQAFLDVPDYAWYADYVYTAVRIGLIKEANGFVNPDEEITRGEFAFMADTLLNIRECRDVDSDADGMPDSWESANGLDLLLADDAVYDNDNDGLTNLAEFLISTLPDNPDTDSDGIPDGQDEAPLTPQPSVTECPCIGNPNQNDTDDDGIPDKCDDDIDDDAVLNNICAFDESGLLIPDEIGEDNCPFIANPDQQDTDGDGAGDACVPYDLCPMIPEDIDGVDDEDGCPEVDDQTAENAPGVYVNRGPLCGLLDYAADLMPGDIIMTAITDTETHTTIFGSSNEVQY